TRSTPLDPKLMVWCVSYFMGAFRTVSLPYKTQFKRAELVQLIQKLKPRSRVGIFGNERTRSTPLDPKLMVWRISYYLIAFVTVLLCYETRFKTGQPSAINAKVCATKLHQNFSQRTHLIHPIGP